MKAGVYGKSYIQPNQIAPLQHVGYQAACQAAACTPGLPKLQLALLWKQQLLQSSKQL